MKAGLKYVLIHRVYELNFQINPFLQRSSVPIFSHQVAPDPILMSDVSPTQLLHNKVFLDCYFTP